MASGPTCSCIICHKEVASTALISHCKSHRPKIYKNNCIICNTPTNNETCCSHKCSATYTNKLRKDNGWGLSFESKSKISTTLKSKPPRKKLQKPPSSKLYFLVCSECSLPFTWSSKRKTCSDFCHREITIKNGIKSKSIKYNGISFHSSWEVKLAKFLDVHNINWTRQIEGIRWVDESNVSHNYYPDFYLKDFNLYLDPKNPYRIIQDKCKIDYLTGKMNLLYGNIDHIISDLVAMIGLKPTYDDSPAFVAQCLSFRLHRDN